VYSHIDKLSLVTVVQTHEKLREFRESLVDEILARHGQTTWTRIDANASESFRERLIPLLHGDWNDIGTFLETVNCGFALHKDP
jgi:hypothetical protein